MDDAHITDQIKELQLKHSADIIDEDDSCDSAESRQTDENSSDESLILSSECMSIAWKLQKKTFLSSPKFTFDNI